MNDPIIFDLINREIDGENSASESASLRVRLAEDPEARRFFDQLWKLSASLDSMPLSEAPAGLAAAILSYVRTKRAGTAPSGEWETRRSPAWGFIKYAYVFAAGLLLGALLAPPLLDRIRGLNAPETGDLLGSMARIGQFSESNWSKVEVFGVAAGGGTARIRQSGRLTLLEVELRGDALDRASLEFDGSRLELRGFEQPGGAPLRGQISSGRVTWMGNSGSRVRFLFARIQTGETAVGIGISGSGGELGRASISLPPE